MSQEWVITKHAVERYRDRCDAAADDRTARKALQSAAERAAPLKEKTNAGDTMWRAEDGLILITKRDKGKTWIVTVITEAERMGMTAGELELVREYAVLALEPLKKGQGQINRLAQLDLMQEGAAKLKKRLKAALKRADEAETRLRELKEGPTTAIESPKKVRRAMEHACRMEADKVLMNRILRLALRALKGRASEAEVWAYIEACDPGLAGKGFFSTSIPPAESRDAILQRLLVKNNVAAVKPTEDGPEGPAGRTDE